MSILTRYVLAELLKVFLLTLMSLTLLVLILLVAKQASDEALGPAQIVQLIPYILPDVLRFTIPGTALFAATTVYGRMASSNEVLAVKALGIHPRVMIMPIFFGGAILSLVTVVLNDVAVSWGRDGIQRVIQEAVEQVAYSMLERHKSYTNRRFTITVKGVKDRKLILPTIIFQGTEQAPSVTVTAETAELRNDPKTQELTFVIFNGSATSGGIRYLFDKDERQIPLPSVSDSQAPGRLPLRGLPEAVARVRAAIQKQEQQIAAQIAFDALTGDFSRMTDRKHLDVVSSQRVRMVEELSRLETEPHRRWATGFSCLTFVLVGAPLAIWVRRAEFYASFALCFLPILIIYYPLIAITLNYAKDGLAPPVIVWLGNAVLVVPGMWLLRKVYRY